MNTTILLELLSAGVIAALVTGIFSLVIAVKNNRRLIELEKSKQKFTVDQERYKGLRDAYGELLRLLPEEKLLGHIVMNLPSKEDFQENGLSESFKVAEENMKILYSHFQKYCYLLLEDEQKTVANLVEEIDNVTKSIINLNSGIQKYNTDEEENSIESFDIIHAKIIERIIKVTEFEEMYYDLFKNNLSKMSNLNSKN
ncbi:hypothetical protein WKT07_08665 [Mediterraneibacter sp. HCN-7094]